MIAIHDATGVDIPEADYAKMASVDDAVAYLRARVGLVIHSLARSVLP